MNEADLYFGQRGAVRRAVCIRRHKTIERRAQSQLQDPAHRGGFTTLPAVVRLSDSHIAKPAPVSLKEPPPQPSPASGRGGRQHPMRAMSTISNGLGVCLLISAPSIQRNALPLPLAGEGWGGGSLQSVATMEMCACDSRSSGRYLFEGSKLVLTQLSYQVSDII
jgi:hypothetical protein